MPLVWPQEHSQSTNFPKERRSDPQGHVHRLEPTTHVSDKHVFPDPTGLHVGPTTVWTASRLIALIEATNPETICLPKEGSEHRDGLETEVRI
jgi:hypothetical protein